MSKINIRVSIIFCSVITILLHVKNCEGQSHWVAGGNSNGGADPVTTNNQLGTTTGNNVALDIQTDGSTRIHVNGTGASQDGFVGIGTATPSSLLHVNTTANTNVFTQITNSASTTGLLLGVAATSGIGVINMHDNKALNFYTHNVIRLHIDDDNTQNRGYVGIGNGFLLPTCRLHINETGVFVLPILEKSGSSTQANV